MRKLLIKLNIFALLLILPLQGFAAASLLLCHSLHDVRATQSQKISKQTAAVSPCHLPAADSADENTSSTRTICTHCFACGISAPAVLSNLPHLIGSSEKSGVPEMKTFRYISFIPPGLQRPPAQA